MEGWTLGYDAHVGYGDGSDSWDTPEFVNESESDDDEDTVCSLDCDSFIFFVRILCAVGITSLDGSSCEFTYTTYWREVARADFLADSRGISRATISAAVGDDLLCAVGPEIIESLVEDLATAALTAATEKDHPALAVAASASASGHTALRVFQNLKFEFLLDERDSAEAAESAVGALEEAAVDGSTAEEQCVVCLEELGGDKAMVRLPCSHLYHRSCVLRWLDISHFCPLCRYSIPKETKSST